MFVLVVEVLMKWVFEYEDYDCWNLLWGVIFLYDGKVVMYMILFVDGDLKMIIKIFEMGCEFMVEWVVNVKIILDSKFVVYFVCFSEVELDKVCEVKFKFD